MRLIFGFVTGGMVLSLANCTSVKSVQSAAVPPASVVQSKAVTASDSVAKTVTKCNLGNDLRLIEIEDLKPVGCKVWYTRVGTRGEIASSRIGRQHCEQISIKIKTNLEAGGYKCASGNQGPS